MTDHHTAAEHGRSVDNDDPARDHDPTCRYGEHPGETCLAALNRFNRENAHREAPWVAEGRHPTVEEWLARFDGQTPEQRVAALRVLFLSAQLGDLCQRAEHSGYPEQLHRVNQRLSDSLDNAATWHLLADRYRLAWLSARRRAQQQADAMDHLFGDQAPALTLVLDETTGDVAWVPLPEDGTGAPGLAGTIPHDDDLTTPGEELPHTWWTCDRTDPRAWPRPVHKAGPCTAPPIPVTTLNQATT